MKQNPLLSGLPVIVILEAAPGLAASNISKHMDDFAIVNQVAVNYIRECDDSAIGVLKTKQTNVEYRYCLEYVLKNKSLCWDPDIVTLHPTNTPKKELERLGEMMRAYHYDEKKKIITSKTDFETDDTLSALNQLLFWGNVFWTSMKYLYVRSHIVQISGCDFPFVTNGAFRPKMKF